MRMGATAFIRESANMVSRRSEDIVQLERFDRIDRRHRRRPRSSSSEPLRQRRKDRVVAQRRQARLRGFEYEPYCDDSGCYLLVRPTDIYTINPDGCGRTRLTTDGYNYHPTWSPDGTKIAFAHDYDIYVMNADGQNAKQVLDGTYGTYSLATYTTTDWQPIPNGGPPTARK
jgi:WD40 repeat protein